MYSATEPCKVRLIVLLLIMMIMNHPKESCDLFNFGFRAVLNFKTGEAMHLKFITGIIMTYHASVMLVFCSPCVPCVTSERYLMLLMTQKLFSNSKNDFRTVYIYETMMLKMSLYTVTVRVFIMLWHLYQGVCVCVCVCVIKAMKVMLYDAVEQAPSDESWFLDTLI